jgi:hypothetical protein
MSASLAVRRHDDQWVTASLLWAAAGPYLLPGPVPWFLQHSPEAPELPGLARLQTPMISLITGNYHRKIFKGPFHYLPNLKLSTSSLKAFVKMSVFSLNLF